MPKEYTKEQYRIENKYLKEQLILTKNAFYFAKEKIKELESILNNISNKINELESDMSSQIISAKNNNNKINNRNISQNIKTVLEPTPKKNIQNKRKYPEHEMYKYVIRTSE